MKHVRLRTRFPENTRNPVHQVLVERDDVGTVHLLTGGVRADQPAYLYYVEGDADALVAGLEGAAVDAFEVTTVEDGHHLHVRDDPGGVELAMRAAFTQGTLVPQLPIVYHADGTATAAVVGSLEDVSAAVEAAPVEVDVEAVREYAGHGESGAALTGRQREVVVAAREAGYYEVPRTASQEDVAAGLDLAASTVAEHLRKAEARLVDAALE